MHQVELQFYQALLPPLEKQVSSHPKLTLLVNPETNMLDHSNKLFFFLKRTRIFGKLNLVETCLTYLL